MLQTKGQGWIQRFKSVITETARNIENVERKGSQLRQWKWEQVRGQGLNFLQDQSGKDGRNRVVSIENGSLFQWNSG